jgi:imidazolonepropionase-like amidohydrolase
VTSRRLALVLVLATALGCHGARSGAGPDGGSPWVVRGAHGAEGESIELAIRGERLVPLESAADASALDLSGYFVVPAFIDSHVHLSYYDVAASLPAGGISAAADFAAPLARLAVSYPLPVVQAGPMLTPPAGYPLESWGSAGYGLEVSSPEAAAAAVDQLLDAGASFIKAPLMGELGVDDATLAALVERAHERGAKVAVHATSLVEATRAIESGIDILGHTPTELLGEEVLDEFGERAVVSTLDAFGLGADTLQNLRALADRGALVLYGTDLGNTRDPRIQPAEIAALSQAGFSGAEIVRAGTASAAEFWGFNELGRLEPGRRASFLVLDADPGATPSTLSTPHAVVIDGRVVAGALPEP